jgi:hypothetical protein
MSPFLFRCSNTGLRVRGFVVEKAPSDDPDSDMSVCCLSCGQMHVVNFTTRKSVGEDGVVEGATHEPSHWH